MIQSDIISAHKMSGSATCRSSGDAGVALELPFHFDKKKLENKIMPQKIVKFNARVSSRITQILPFAI